MSKKKATTTRATKPAGRTPPAKAPTAANPAPVKDVVRPPAFNKPVSWNFAGVGRNDICPCGSGKRFKNCHGH